NMSLTDINASLTKHNLHQQCKLFSKEEEPANYVLMAFSSSSSSSDTELSPSKSAQDLSYTNRPTALIIEDRVFDSEDESETKAPQIDPSFVQSTKQVKTPRYSVQPLKTSIPVAPPKPTSPKFNSSGKRRNRKTCFVCKSVDHLIKDCDYHAIKMAQPTHMTYAHRGNNKQHASLTHKNPPKHMVPDAVVTQSKPVYINVVRPVSAAVPKIMVTRPRLAYPIVTKSKSPIRRHITHSPSLKTSNSPPKVTAAQASMVSVAQGIKGKWGNPQHALKDKGVIDSGCSRHMTGNMSYLSNFEELNGGYVTFGGNPKGGKIFGKGKIKTGKLDFDDVYFVKELKFNLFNVSQMCDKKNNVLFIDTECLVLSPDFKLPDESQVLLRVPRENNITPSIGFMRPFGCPVTILNTLDSLGKFEGKVDEGFLVGYSINSSGPTWLFDIDSLTRTMNYQPVIAGNQTNPSEGFQDKFDAEKAGEEVDQQYMLFPVCTNPFSADGPSNTTASPTHRQSSLKDASQPTDDPDMPELEDITYSDDDNNVGAEADFNNLETSITVSPIPTTRIHKDHPVSQIIGDLSSATQTRRGTQEVAWIEAIRLFFLMPPSWDLWCTKWMLNVHFYMELLRKKCMFVNPQIYVDDIIFGATNKDLCKSFEKPMKDKFQMSSMGELTFFLGLQDNDVTRMQALVDKKKVVVTEAAIRDVLWLDDAVGVDCLTNEEIFVELARQDIKEGRNEEEHVEKVTTCDTAQGDDAQEPSIPSPTLPTQPPQDLPSTSQVQHTPPQSRQAQPQTQPQPQPAADFPTSLLQEALDACATLTRRVEHLEYDKMAQALKITKLKRRVKKLEKGNIVKVLKLRRLKRIGTSQKIDTSNDTVMDDESNQGRILDEMDKMIETVTAASTITSAAEPQVPAATITAAPIKVAAAPSRRMKGMVIRDPKEESTTSSIILAETKSKDKGKGILVEEPKPLKKKQQVEMDEEYVRKLHAELNKDIEWDVAIDHIKLKAKEDPAVQRYQAMKRKPQTEAQAQKNMMMYLKNVMKEEERKALQRINETPAERAAKRRKLDEEVEISKDIWRLYLMKMIIEELEVLWNLVKERFSTSKPKNFSDDFLLTTLGAMFEKPDVQAQVWKNQRTKEELSAAKEKLMLLDSATEERLMLLSS
nr:ribonuclease H-like domain-containing protein [Tanacetum cinerariifolium]